MLSRTITPKLQKLTTPFYLYDITLLRSTLRSVVEHSSRYGYVVHYALKANFEERILREALAAGLGVDCVSGNEIRRCIEVGFPASGIVFAGVGKSDSEIEYALRQNIFAFNAESRAELEVIDSIAGRIGLGHKARVALRINPDVEPNTHKYISTGQADSKFGISYTEVEQVAAELSSLGNIEITGLHFHIGSQIRDMTAFENLARRAGELYNWFMAKGFSLKHINLGGGLGIDYDNPEGELIPNFDAYFDIFHRLLKVPADVEVHFELGRSIVGQCGELVSRVLFTKINAAGKNVAIIDASMTELIRPALYHARHAIENLGGEEAGAENGTTNACGARCQPVGERDGERLRSTARSTFSQPAGPTERSPQPAKAESVAARPAAVYTIGGPVCESSDIFVRDVTLPELRRGDLVTIKSAGAYGTAMASHYNLHALPSSYFSDEI